jgi:hypothetical protein
MIRKPAFLLPALLGLALVVSACDDDETTSPTPPDGTSVLLRAVHASPDAPAVDIYANDGTTPLVEDVAYGEVTAYLDIPEGTYNIQLRAAGSSSSSDPAYETGDLTLTDGQVITAIATGFLGSTDAADQFRVLPLFENFGNARVRIVHAAPDAPTVAIDVGDDGPLEISALARFGDTGEEGVELPAGSALQIGIVEASGGNRVTTFTTPELPDGGELFVIAIGSLADLARESTGFSLLAALGAPGGLVGIIGQNPVVYALHGGPDAPAVDIFAGDLELANNLAFGGLSSAIQVPPGSYTLDFFPTSPGPTRPGGAPAASLDTPDLEAGQRYLTVATGFLVPDAQGEQPFQLAAFREAFDLTDSSNARVQASHASPDAPAVDIGTVGGGGTIDAIVFENLMFPMGMPDVGASVPAAALTLGVAVTGSVNPVATFDVTTVGGLRAFAVAIGALAPDAGEEAFRLAIVDTGAAPWTVAEVNPNP